MTTPARYLVLSGGLISEHLELIGQTQTYVVYLAVRSITTEILQKVLIDLSSCQSSADYNAWGSRANELLKNDRLLIISTGEGLVNASKKDKPNSIHKIYPQPALNVEKQSGIINLHLMQGFCRVNPIFKKSKAVNIAAMVYFREIL